jgi:uncharacterized membrane protein
VLRWACVGAVPAGRLLDALRVLGILPDAREWRRFLDRLTLFAGATALGAAVIFFVAANWAAIGRFGKFALVEALVVAAVAVYAALGSERASSKAALLAATLGLGALLAFVGQTYQTGADTFELFSSWAALMLPWVLLARMPALWILWIAVVNLAVGFYFAVFGGLFGILLSTEQMLWATAAFDTAALLVWEIAAGRVAWLRERWAPRLLAVASGSVVTMLALQRVVDLRNVSSAILAVYPGWLALGYAVYRRAMPDLFMLAGGCLSIIAVVTTFLARHLLDDDVAGGFLLIGLVVIGMAGAAAVWLRRVAAEEPA